jgi:hypothetical protein
MQQKSKRYDETTPAAIRTEVLARISAFSEYEAGICRITVVGDAQGPASRPPRVNLYIKDGGEPEKGRLLRPDEARRCRYNLRIGDLILAVGDLGPERERASRQEVIVSEPVRLKWRPPVDPASVVGSGAGRVGVPA